VAIDGSKESMNAARHAIGLAKKYGTRLIALTAMRLPSLYGWSRIIICMAKKIHG